MSESEKSDRTNEKEDCPQIARGREIFYSEELNKDPLKIFNKENECIFRITSIGKIFVKDNKEVNIDIDGQLIVKAFSDFLASYTNKTFSTYQTQAHTTALYLDNIKDYLTPNVHKMLALSYVGLGLGESGEVQNKLKKIIRDKNGIIDVKTKDDLKKELGDILWYVAEMCTLLHLDMGNVAQANLDKLFKRKDEGKLKGEGDNR